MNKSAAKRRAVVVKLDKFAAVFVEKGDFDYPYDFVRTTVTLSISEATAD